MDADVDADTPAPAVGVVSLCSGMLSERCMRLAAARGP